MKTPTVTGYRWMLYGAYGATGRMILDYALRRGHRPVLGGRDRSRLAELASNTGLDVMPFGINDPASDSLKLGTVDAVLNAAGPYFETGRPLRQLCLDAGLSCVDVNGEIADFADALACDERARERGVAIIPGAGFGIVYGEALASQVASRMPHATWLTLSLAPSNATSSMGALRSTASALAAGGYAVRAGSLIRRPMAFATWKLPHPVHARQSLRFAAAPRAEIIATHRLTRIPDITVGVALPLPAAIVLRLGGRLMGRALLHFTQDRRGAKRTLPDSRQHPPRSLIFAQVGDDKGAHIASVLETGEGYHAAAVAAVHVMEQLAARRPVGALTPAEAFGSDFALSLPDTERKDYEWTNNGGMVMES